MSSGSSGAGFARAECDGDAACMHGVGKGCWTWLPEAARMDGIDSVLINDQRGASRNRGISNEIS